MPYKNPEYGKARRKELRLQNLEYWRQYHKDYASVYEKNPEVILKRRLAAVKKYYNLGAEEYLQMILDQNNVCAICHKAETAKTSKGDTRPLAVDHCHKTGKVRSLLCAKCNGMLGMVDDSEDHLNAAIDYLRKHKEI